MVADLSPWSPCCAHLIMSVFNLWWTKLNQRHYSEFRTGPYGWTAAPWPHKQGFWQRCCPDPLRPTVTGPGARCAAISGVCGHGVRRAWGKGLGQWAQRFCVASNHPHHDRLLYLKLPHPALFILHPLPPSPAYPAPNTSKPRGASWQTGWFASSLVCHQTCVQVQSCYTSTPATIRTIRDGEPRTATYFRSYVRVEVAVLGCPS